MSRKTTDQDIIRAMERIDRGNITQKEIAAELGVTPSALNQRIKKLRAQAVPVSFQSLTEKQKRFALAKVEGKTNLEAVKSAYDVTSNESAKSMATVLMHDPDVNLAIADLLAQEGIPKRRRVQRLRDMIECPDLSIAGRGLDMGFKLAGDYAPQQFEVITPVEIRALLASIEIPNEGGTIEAETVEEKEKAG